MDDRRYVVTFQLDDQRFGLKLAVVERVVRAVAVTPLPHAPATVLGVINLKGQVVAILNIRQRFDLPNKALDVSDNMIICRTARRTVGFIVDKVEDVFAYQPENYVASQGIVPGLECIEGIVKLPDGLFLVHDLDRFLSLEELEVLDAALNTFGQKHDH